MDCGIYLLNRNIFIEIFKLGHYPEFVYLDTPFARHAIPVAIIILSISTEAHKGNCESRYYLQLSYFV